jgi:phage terminase small subunit
MKRYEQFARLYAADPEQNGTRCAISAGCNPNSAHVTASKWLKKSKVQDLIAKFRVRTEEKLDLSAHKVLRELMHMGFANMLDYITPQPDGTAYVDLSKLTRDQAAAIQEVTVDEWTEGRGDAARTIQRVKFKLGDKRGSLELLGRYLKMFTDKVEVTGIDKLPDILQRARQRMKDADTYSRVN